MKTILFGWELGANLGHTKPLAEIARALVGEDIALTVAARDLMSARTAFDGIDVQQLQAPLWPQHRHFGAETGQANYLDALVSIGFADPAKLGAVVGGWLALLHLVKPDVIVVDHSPALLLAAHIRNVAVVQVGTGYTMPPTEYGRLPPIRADHAPMMPENRLLAAMTDVAVKFGGTAPPTLIDLFRTNGRVVFGCPELDVYAPFRRETLYLPPELLPVFTEPPVAPRIFAYLGPELPRIERLLQVLSTMDIALEVYLRGNAAPLGRFLTLRGHRVHDTPPPLSEVLLNASHVISSGGAFTCHAALAAGRPMLAAPLHAEADFNVLAMERMGVAQRFDPWADEKHLRKTIEDFVRNHTRLRQARHWAMVLASRPQPDGARATLAAIRQNLGNGQRASSAA